LEFVLAVALVGFRCSQDNNCNRDKDLGDYKISAQKFCRENQNFNKIFKNLLDVPIQVQYAFTWFGAVMRWLADRNVLALINILQSNALKRRSEGRKGICQRTKGL
jgi:hypothetical protein